MSEIRYNPLTFIHLGNDPKNLNAQPKLIQLSEQDLTKAKEINSKVEEALSSDAKYSVDITSNPVLHTDDCIHVNSFTVTHKKTSDEMTFHTFLHKYDNGNYLISLTSSTDLELFNEEINPSNYKANNLIYKKIANKIFDSIDESSMLISSINEGIEPIYNENINSDSQSRRLSYTPYFRAKFLSQQAISEIQPKASSSIILNDNQVTVQLDPENIVTADATNTDHNQSLFHVLQALKSEA